MPANESLVGARRAFTASDGVAWTVDEYAESAGGGAEDRHLIFECDGVMRRVRNFPRNWRDLGTDALLALSWLR